MSFKILIVEDDPINRKLLVDLLTVNGYEVSEAHNGQEGVQRARSACPNLILLDIQMPLMDGLEAMSILKADAQTQRIPVWVMTSYAMREDVERIRAEGSDLCLTKPFDVPSLLRRIEALATGLQRPGSKGTSVLAAGAGATPLPEAANRGP